MCKESPRFNNEDVDAEVVTASVACVLVGVDVWRLWPGLCWTGPPCHEVTFPGRIPASCDAWNMRPGAEHGLVSVTMVCGCKQTC